MYRKKTKSECKFCSCSCTCILYCIVCLTADLRVHFSTKWQYKNKHNCDYKCWIAIYKQSLIKKGPFWTLLYSCYVMHDHNSDCFRDYLLVSRPSAQVFVPVSIMLPRFNCGLCICSVWWLVLLLFDSWGLFNASVNCTVKNNKVEKTSKFKATSFSASFLNLFLYKLKTTKISWSWLP